MLSYTVTVALNHKEIGKHSKRMKTIKPFIKKYKWEWINVSSQKRWLEKCFRKIIEQLLFTKKEICILLMFQNIT